MDFTKLLLPSADRTFEEEMKAREQSTAAASAPGKKAEVNIPFEELTMLATIGTGTFGRVKLVQHKQSG